VPESLHPFDLLRKKKKKKGAMANVSHGTTKMDKMGEKYHAVVMQGGFIEGGATVDGKKKSDQEAKRVFVAWRFERGLNS
jgi:hypothetical protein